MQRGGRDRVRIFRFFRKGQTADEQQAQQDYLFIFQRFLSYSVSVYILIRYGGSRSLHRAGIISVL